MAGEAGPDGLSPTTTGFGTALADIVRCSTCGHMQLERFPDDRWLADAYRAAASQGYVDEPEGQRQTARSALARIECHVDRGELLDLGCWVGFLVAEACDRGWRAIGVEPSDFASRHAREQLGVDVRTGGLLDAKLGERRFNAVVLGDVIEHLADPGDALRRVRELIAPGGVTWIALPDAGSRIARLLGAHWWSVIPTHLQYFTRASLGVLLARHGFELLELTTAPKSFTVAYYLSRLDGYSPTLGHTLTAGARALGLAGRQWAPDFGDRMAVIARPRPDALVVDPQRG